MTDYLERLFVPAEPMQEVGEEDIFLPPAPAEPQEVEQMPMPELQEQEPDFRAAAPERGEEFWRKEAVRRLESAAPLQMKMAGRVQDTLSVPETNGEGIAIRRPTREREGEEMERRLRRDSRRYDSGFFWY